MTNPFRDINDSLKAQQKEFRLHVACVEQLPIWYPQVAFLHIPNRPGSASDGYFKKIMGTKLGAPDLLFSWRALGRLCGGLIELKAETGRISNDQNRFLSHWAGMGWHTAVERTCKGVFERLKSWGLEPASYLVYEPDLRTDMEKKADAFDFYSPQPTAKDEP